MKQDLTVYSDQELSLVVFNDETLYNMRNRRSLFDLLNEFYLYTDEQLEVLKQDIQDDIEES